MYKVALEDYMRRYPHQANIYLLEIDNYFKKGQYERSLEAIDNQGRLIGKDLLLDLYRSFRYRGCEKTGKEKNVLTGWLRVCLILKTEQLK